MSACLCPECTQGKTINCTLEFPDDNDAMRTCATQLPPAEELTPGELQNLAPGCIPPTRDARHRELLERMNQTPLPRATGGLIKPDPSTTPRCVPGSNLRRVLREALAEIERQGMTGEKAVGWLAIKLCVADDIPLELHFPAEGGGPCPHCGGDYPAAVNHA